MYEQLTEYPQDQTPEEAGVSYEPTPPIPAATPTPAEVCEPAIGEITESTWAKIDLFLESRDSSFRIGDVTRLAFAPGHVPQPLFSEFMKVLKTRASNLGFVYDPDQRRFIRSGSPMGVKKATATVSDSERFEAMLRSANLSSPPPPHKLARRNRPYRRKSR